MVYPELEVLKYCPVNLLRNDCHSREADCVRLRKIALIPNVMPDLIRHPET